MRVLTTAAQLHERLENHRPTTVLDVRWALGDPDGRGQYEAGHIPGAVFVDLEKELAAPGTASAGRHPLPAPEDFAAAVRRWGVNDGDAVVAYDATGGLAAARAWWLLRHAGFPDVTLLDGGLAAWTGAGHELETGWREPAPGDASSSWGHMPVVDIDAAAGWPAHGVLLDARAEERYRGDAEPVDPRAGHIPGAVSAPTLRNLDERAAFVEPAVLRERFAALGADGSRPVAAYCGSGVTAAHEIAALAAAGVDAALFPGSWSQWSNDRQRPVATGDEP